VEAGMILGLTAAGYPSPMPPAAVFISDCFSHTSPALGWFTLLWLRRPRVCLTKSLRGFAFQNTFRSLTIPGGPT